MLTVGADGQGTVVPPVGSYTYEKGKSVTISAYPAKDWKFDGWAGDSSNIIKMYNGAKSNQFGSKDAG